MHLTELMQQLQQFEIFTEKVQIMEKETHKAAYFHHIHIFRQHRRVAPSLCLEKFIFKPPGSLPNGFPICI